MSIRSKLLAVSGILLALSGIARAEPWISNRFAQNCAGCHAPGRINKPPEYRRCTLSCQGCHVNPNGGGLRSFYGKWNENRWLRSFRPDELKHPKAPAPYEAQPYADNQSTTKQAPKFPAKGAKAPPKDFKKDTHPKSLSVIDDLDIDETKYDRSDGLEQIVAKDQKEFQAQIPAQDPFFETQQSKVTAGGDLRYQIQQLKYKRSAPTGGGKGKSWKSFFMSADVGIDWRPIYRRYHLVYEGRYIGDPNGTKIQKTGDDFTKRSLYAMADDLPYNTYVMAGYYRPLFGNVTPDHTALAQRMTSYALQETPYIYNLQYQAYTIGGSPNVPFMNVHLIQHQYGGKPNDNNKGIAANIGGRFVTLGASFMYSYWSTQKDEVVAGEKVTKRVQMHSVTGGFTVARLIANVEALGILKDVPNQAYRKALIGSLDLYYRTWREIYLTSQYAQANLTEQLTPGNITQFRLGVRSFLVAGVDMTLLYGVENQEMQATSDGQAASNTVSQDIQAQLHLYF